MKNKFVSLLAIILGIIIIAFPMIGVIGTSSLIGLSVLLISIYLLFPYILRLLLRTRKQNPFLSYCLHHNHNCEASELL